MRPHFIQTSSLYISEFRSYFVYNAIVSGEIYLEIILYGDLFSRKHLSHYKLCAGIMRESYAGREKS